MWSRIKKFFKDSETIALAYLQMVLGAVAAIITFVDPHLITSLFPGASWAPWFLLAHGIALKWLRMRRADDLAS